VKGSIRSQVYFIIKNISNIGVSKKTSRLKSNVTGQNGRKVSESLHSYKYIVEVKNTALQLGNFAKENFNISNFEKINNDILLEFFKYKIDQKKLSFRTISTYISHCEKIAISLQKIAKQKDAKYKGFDRIGLSAASQYKVDHAKKNQHINRAYINPLKIISNLKNVDHMIVASVQLEAGVRVGEALKFKPEQLLGNNQIEVRIKGGNRLIVQVDSLTYQEVQTRVNNAIKRGKIGHKILYKDFHKDLKQAVEKSGEKWNGTHGIRYTYAQRRNKELAKEGKTPLVSQKIISIEMGHQRPEVTVTYVGVK